VQLADSDEMRWLGEFSMPQAQLASVVADDCNARAMLQFVRAPFAVEEQGRWIIGDLRFDREAGLGMAEREVAPAAGADCPRSVPWVPPRADLLGARAGS
jgi:inner membrane protein